MKVDREFEEMMNEMEKIKWTGGLKINKFSIVPELPTYFGIDGKRIYGLQDTWKPSFPDYLGVHPDWVWVDEYKEVKVEKRRKFKIVSIDYDKFVNEKGIPYVKITGGFENVAEEDDLPDEYLKPPYFYLVKFQGLLPYVVLITEDTVYELWIGSLHTKDEWEDYIVPSLLEAGKKLGKILLKENWRGSYKLII